MADAEEEDTRKMTANVLRVGYRRFSRYGHVAELPARVKQHVRAKNLTILVGKVQVVDVAITLAVVALVILNLMEHRYGFAAAWYLAGACGYLHVAARACQDRIVLAYMWPLYFLHLLRQDRPLEFRVTNPEGWEIRGVEEE